MPHQFHLMLHEIHFMTEPTENLRPQQAFLKLAE